MTYAPDELQHANRNLYKFLPTQFMCHSMFSLILSDWLISEINVHSNNIFEFCDIIANFVLMHLMAIDIRYVCILVHIFLFFIFFCRRNSENKLLIYRNKISASVISFPDFLSLAPLSFSTSLYL